MIEFLLTVGAFFACGVVCGLGFGYRWGFWTGYDEGHQNASYAVLGKFLPKLPPVRPRR